jgi:soluble lytic murein transglycosylase
MSFSEKTILAFVLLLLTGCAAAKTPPPNTVAAAMPGPGSSPASGNTPFAGPGRGLKSALDAYKAGNMDMALSLAWQVREQYPRTPWYKRSLFLTEQALIRMDRASEAEAAMLRVRDEYPLMADYALFILAEYHYSNKRFSQAAVLYQQLIERYPRSSLAIRAAFRNAQALLESDALAPAAAAFEKFLLDNPRSGFCADAGIGLGKALIADEETARAVRALRNVQVKCPGTPAEPDVEQSLAWFRSSGVEVPELAPEELYERGKNLFKAGQYDKAAETFTKLLALEPPYPDKPEVLLRNGISLFNLGRRAEAAATFEKLAQDFPGDQRVPEALYWLGKAYSKLGERDKGIQAFRRILDSYSESEWADDALFLTGNIYREADDLKKALTFYGRLAEEYPESRFADSAFWWQAWAYYGSGEYRKAEQTLQELVLRYPKSFLVNQARYWQGRISEKTGSTAKAAAYYGHVQKRAPYTYYGYRAAERLAGIQAQTSDAAVKKDETVLAAAECEGGPCSDDGAGGPDTDDGPPVWTDEALKTLSTEPAFTRSLELLYLDMKKEAAAELSLLSARLSRKRGALLGLSKTFFELGDYYRSLMLVLTNYERYLDGKAGDTPQDFWLLAYPQGYWDSIVSYSRKYGQDPYFIAAIIREESQFHAEALSPAGARGVMQVMPATGAWVAQMIRVPGFDPNKLFDSDTAINIGTWYIAHLMKRFKGDALFTAAAYNAGPEAVSAWLARSRGTERDEFVEYIPFSETRGYVKKVMRNYAEYKRIYGRTEKSASRSVTRDDGIPGPLAGSPGVQTP